MKTALTIAGSDPSGGAGIQADLKTFHAHGVFGMSVVTAVTVQNTRKVYDIQEIDPAIVSGQIDCLFEDISIDAVKIGMVSSVPLIEAIHASLAGRELPPVVLDPVMISKSGYPLLREDAREALVKMLFPLATVVTPNIHEAEFLCGFPVGTTDEMKRAALYMCELGAKRAVIKGGHLSGDEAADLLFDGSQFEIASTKRIDTRSTHGTGCTFSSAVAANIARGMGFFEAARRAKEYVTNAIARAPGIGKGSGPLNHMISPP